MEEAKAVDTLFLQGSDLPRHPKGATPLEGKNMNMYESTVRALLHLGQVMRYDLCCTACQLAKAIAPPTGKHPTAANKALRYLKSKPDLKRIHRRRTKLTACCDSNFGTSDSAEHESITGVIVILGKGPILHPPRTPRTICSSSTGTKLMAIHHQISADGAGVEHGRTYNVVLRQRPERVLNCEQESWTTGKALHRQASTHTELCRQRITYP